jgi:hypothetical protein
MKSGALLLLPWVGDGLRHTLPEKLEVFCPKFVLVLRSGIKHDRIYAIEHWDSLLSLHSVALELDESFGLTRVSAKKFERELLLREKQQRGSVSINPAEWSKLSSLPKILDACFYVGQQFFWGDVGTESVFKPWRYLEKQYHGSREHIRELLAVGPTHRTNQSIGTSEFVL